VVPEINVPCCARASTENFSTSPGIGSVPVRVSCIGVTELVRIFLLSAVGRGVMVVMAAFELRMHYESGQFEKCQHQ
jgi:hypothetical protein